MGKSVFPDEARKFLGKKSDRWIADTYGISHRTVMRKRDELGISKPRRFKPLTPAQKQQVLKLPTAHAAGKLGMSVTAAREHRLANGIVDVDPAESRIEMNKSQQRKLGKIPDEQLAKIVGCSTSWIAKYRRERGIPAYQREPGVKLDRATRTLLADSTVEEITAATGWTPNRIASLRRQAGLFQRKRRLPQDQIDDLGVLSDEEYAAKYGLERHQARNRRYQLAPPGQTKKKA